MASIRGLVRSTASFRYGRFLSNGQSTSVLSCVSFPRHQQAFQQQYRCYTPLTKQEEDDEKARVAGLSEFAKEQELRQLNREIARLEKLKGINTGELYTWSGKYKALARDYGMPLVAWYWSVWGMTCVASYLAIDFGGVDVMALMMKVDVWTGWDLSSNVKPEYGKVGLAIAVNEILEPIRLPLVIVTVKPVIDRIFPPKY